MIQFFRNFLNDEAGASAAEYALILAIVGTGIAGAAVALGGNISGSFIKNTGGGCGSAPQAASGRVSARAPTSRTVNRARDADRENEGHEQSRVLRKTCVKAILKSCSTAFFQE